MELLKEDDSLESELSTESLELKTFLNQLELKSLLSGPHDSCDAIVSIHARDGGTDTNDWAEMMLHVFDWANKKNLALELLDGQDHDVAGIQNATVTYEDHGPGYLRGEMGIHRLVRISPFNAEGQTSFAAVDVT